MRLSDLAKNSRTSGNDTQAKETHLESHFEEAVVEKVPPDAPTSNPELFKKVVEGQEKGISLSQILSGAESRPTPDQKNQETHKNTQALEESLSGSPQTEGPISLSQILSSQSLKTETRAPSQGFSQPIRPGIADETNPALRPKQEGEQTTTLPLDDESPALVPTPTPSIEIQPPVPSQTTEAPNRSHNNGQSLYSKLAQALIGLLQGVVRKKRLRLDELTSLVDLMVTEKSEMEELYRLSLSARDEDNSLSRHMVHVATYSVKLAQGLRLSDQKIRKCALTALLHDVGMCLIPPELRHKNGRLTSHEAALLHKHPDYGYQIIKAHLGDEFQWLAEVVRQEHERENGTGYPHALFAERIDEGAKIIGVADVYEALTHDRPHRPRLLPYRAVKEIMESQKGLFSPKVLKAMLQQLSVFPLNSLVRLNSNAIARVLETYEGQPLRPTVQVMYDPKGDFIREGRVLSLRENPLLYIVDSVDETELRYS